MFKVQNLKYAVCTTTQITSEPPCGLMIHGLLRSVAQSYSCVASTGLCGGNYIDCVLMHSRR